jgi:radical SAM protein with 4Fe4S-binding SPASM domain
MENISDSQHGNRQLVLPEDSVLLPLIDGQLLVSPTFSVFCKINENEVPLIKAIINNQYDQGIYNKDLIIKLTKHGFFAEPRPVNMEDSVIQLQLTNYCNVSCNYCCTNSGSPRKNELSFDEWCSVASEAFDILGLGGHIGILGGEPLTIPWVFELSNRIIKLGLKLTIYSNGIPLSDKKIAKLAAKLSKKGVSFRFSLAGVNSELCDEISGAKRFDKALTGINQFFGYGGRAQLTLMLLPQHIEKTATGLAELKDRLPKNTPLNIGVLYVSGREEGEQVYSSRSALENSLDHLALTAGVRIPGQVKGALTNRRDGCGCALGKHLHIRSDGVVFPCFKMEEEIGVWRESSLSHLVATMRGNPSPASKLETCRDCPLVSICGGGCRSENLMYTMDANQPFCGTWRVRVLSELLSEGRVDAVKWSISHLLSECQDRSIEVPDGILKIGLSRSLLDN